MSKINFLAVDLDGVCISMSQSAAYAHNIELPKGIIPDDFLYKAVGNKKEFWRKCRGNEFWANLEPYEWAKELLTVIDKSGIDWCFLSKTSRDSGSSSGKYECVEKFFPKYLNKLWLARGTKSYMASEGKALLDDKIGNINEWEAAGGIGIHWPELHPSEIEMARNRIERIGKILTDGS